MEISYGSLTIIIETKTIREDQAGNLARQMAQRDAMTVYEQMVEFAPDFNPDNMFMPGAFKPAYRMLDGALEVIGKLDLCFGTDGAEHIFETTYMHEFFGTFVSLLYARSQGRHNY